MTRARWLATAILLATSAGSTIPLAAQEPPVRDEDGAPPPSVRDLELRVLVDGDPVELLEAWLDAERVDRFFGVGSTIEPRLGGRYEIRFLPGEDPESRANSTRGSRILALEPGRHLAFEWRLPPWAAEPARSAPATRVDVRLERADDPAGGGRTVLHLRHSGFGDGSVWDQVRSFFQRSWFEILDRYRDLVGASSGAGQQLAAREPAGPEIRAQFGRLVGDWDIRQWRKGQSIP